MSKDNVADYLRKFIPDDAVVQNGTTIEVTIDPETAGILWIPKRHYNAYMKAETPYQKGEAVVKWLQEVKQGYVGARFKLKIVGAEQTWSL